MPTSTRQSRRAVAENNSENSTPTRRWQRLVVDDDSDEKSDEDLPRAKTPEKVVFSWKTEHENADTAGRSAMDSRAEPNSLVTALFPTPEASTTDSQCDSAEIAPSTSLEIDTTKATTAQNASIGNSEGEQTALETNSQTSKSQADNVEEAEDQKVDGVNENVTAVRKQEFGSRANEDSHPVTANDDPNEHSQDSFIPPNSPLSSPPTSQADSKFEAALTDRTMTPPASAPESNLWNQAMSLDSEIKQFVQESRSRRETSRMKNQDGAAESLKRKRDRPRAPCLPSAIMEVSNVEQSEYSRYSSGVVGVPASVGPTALPIESEKSEADEHSMGSQRVTSVEDIVKAVKEGSRKSFTVGDVAIITDTGDLSKTLLVSSIPLLEHTTLLESDIHSNISPLSTLKHVFILEASESLSAMPQLVHIKDADRAGVDLVENTSYQHSLELATAVKHEHTESQHETGTAELLPQINWTKAFEAFLVIVTSTNGSLHRAMDNILRIIGNKAKAALPQIEGIIEFAKHFKAMDAIITTLTLVIHRYGSNDMFWKAVSEEAASWLLIGQDIEDEALFKEALVHVASRWPQWPWSKSKGCVPEDLQTSAEVLRNEIEIKHQATQVKLLRLTLHNADGARIPIPVSQRNAPYKYDVVCFWSHWIASHFDYVEQKRHTPGLAEPPKSDFCDHSDPACLNVARLYHAIEKGGDAYLPFEVMRKKFDEKTYDFNEAEQRDALAELKKAASIVVAPMAESHLRYNSKHELEYLTCIQVEAKDVLWKMHEEDQYAEMEI